MKFSQIINMALGQFEKRMPVMKFLISNKLNQTLKLNSTLF
jgi:hypothetical protein